MEFKDSSVVVTGGAIGLGNTFCRRFAAEGARVAVLDVDINGARTIVESLAENGVTALASSAI